MHYQYDSSDPSSDRCSETELQVNGAHDGPDRSARRASEHLLSVAIDDEQTIEGKVEDIIIDFERLTPNEPGDRLVDDGEGEPTIDGRSYSVDVPPDENITRSEVTPSSRHLAENTNDLAAATTHKELPVPKGSTTGEQHHSDSTVTSAPLHAHHCPSNGATDLETS